MSKKPNTTLIGAFVIGAVVIVVAALIIFGGGRFFREAKQFVLFFEGSVQGLNKGAPVAFKGVRVGSVTDIKVVFDSHDLSLKIPVFIDVELDRISGIGKNLDFEALLPRTEGMSVIEYMIEKGLRAQLDIQSLVTGQLYVNLDFFPDKPARLSGIHTGYPELPTIPSSLEQISKTVERLPIEDMITKIQRALEGIERWVNSPELAEIVASLNITVKEVEGIAENVNRQIHPMLVESGKVLKEMKWFFRDARSKIDPLVTDARKLLRNADTRITTVASTLEKTLETAQHTLVKAEGAIANLEGAVGEESALQYELYTTLKELSATARSMRTLTDYLERQPSAFLRGKPTGGEQ